VDGVADTITGFFNRGVTATVAELGDMQARARVLRGEASQMMDKRARLQSAMASVKSPAVLAAIRAHLNRGFDIQARVADVLRRVDSVLGATKTAAGGMVLNAVPLVGAAVFAGVMAAIGAVYYMINSYNKDTDALLLQLDTVRASGGTPEQLTRVIEAANKSEKSIVPAGVVNNKRVYIVGGVLLLGAFLYWNHKK
jgi:hypothetical protein